MQKRKLGASGLEITPVVLGAWAIGGAFWGGQEEKESREAIEASLAAGVGAIDTAPVYGFGGSEEVVGRAIRGRRDDVVLATKCGLRWDLGVGELKMEVPLPDGSTRKVWYDLRPESIRQECEQSLRRLGTDWIDLYQIHWPDPVHPLEDALGELARLRQEGKVRHLGVSNFDVEELEVAVGRAGIVSDQPQYNLVDRAVEERVLPWCREHSVGVVAYSPMARGLLTGKYGPGTAFGPGDHRRSVAWFRPEFLERAGEPLAILREVARRHGASPGNVAVAWVLARPGVTAALVGARDAEQARQNARGASLQLEEDEVRRLSEAFASL